MVPSLDSEPKDQFLEPAVDELKSLWKGVRLKSCPSRFALTFWAAILSISSDVPDTRKICGLKGHSVILGCSCCLKKFPSGFGEKRDYSGFDRNSWSPRVNEDHWRQATKISRSKTNEEQNFIWQKSGISHYSVLLDIEYFEIIRFCTIDPMNNLFLGTSKKLCQLWNDLKLFSKGQ